MKGLLKNNFYAAWANAKVFVVFLFLFGAFTVAVVSQSLVIGFVLTGIIGFSVNAAAVTKNEFVSKWGKYKLTLPVRRADIIISLFLNMAAWMLAGMVFAVAVTGLSWLLHGCPFDNSIDMLSMFALGISMSLFTGALFFPLFYLGGEERSEVFLVISLLCAFGIDFTIISVWNELAQPGIRSIVMGAAVLVGCSLLAFVLSCPLTVQIFKRKEY